MSGIDGIEQAVIHFFERPALSAIGNAIGIIGGTVAFAKFLVSGINGLIREFSRSKEPATKGIPSKKFLRLGGTKSNYHP